MYGRGPGIAGLQRAAAQKEEFQRVGTALAQDQLARMHEQLKTFRASLEEFAKKYRSQINKNPELREHFHSMCTSVGVDPLMSSKGFWAQLLGVGDFYYELAVQIVDICIATRPTNGGLIELKELQRILGKSPARRDQKITTEDVERAIKKLHVLGNGFDVVTLGQRRLLQSVPTLLSADHGAVLQAARSGEGVAASELRAALGWRQERVALALEHLLREGMGWVDEQGAGGAGDPLYWFPCLRAATFDPELASAPSAPAPP